MQAVLGRHNIPQYYPYVPRAQPPRRRRLKIIYELPKVVVVQHYTRIIIPSVNPDAYRRQYHKVLLDTNALIDWCRRLNIPENLVNRIKIQFISII